MCSYRAAYLRFFFSHMQKSGFYRAYLSGTLLLFSEYLHVIKMLSNWHLVILAGECNIMLSMTTICY